MGRIFIGLIVGLAGAVAAALVLTSMLYSVGAGDGVVFAGAGAAMIIIAFAATAMPARRAIRVDPLVALRAE